MNYYHSGVMKLEVRFPLISIKEGKERKEHHGKEQRREWRSYHSPCLVSLNGGKKMGFAYFVWFQREEKKKRTCMLIILDQVF